MSTSDLLPYCFFLVLTAVVVLSLATLYLNVNFRNRSLFDKVIAVFLIFLVFHSIYVCVMRYGFDDVPFADIGAPFSLFYGPFFYASLLALKKSRNWNLSIVLIHMIPALLFGIIYIAFLLDLDYFRAYIPKYLLLLYLGAGVQFIVYALYGFIKFNNSFDTKELKLVTNYAVKIMVIVALIFLSLVFESERTRGEKSYIDGLVIYFLMLVIAAVVFRYHVINIFKHYGADIVETPVKLTKIAVNESENTIKKKYEKSSITEQEGIVYLARLNKMMEVEKVYLDSELTIDSLSRKLKITKHHLTQVFTVILDTNFNKYINNYRVIHAAKLLKEPNGKVSIGDVGTESGFNSRTSFYRVFKAYHGVSPVDFKKKKTGVEEE